MRALVIRNGSILHLLLEEIRKNDKLLYFDGTTVVVSSVITEYDSGRTIILAEDNKIYSANLFICA